MNKWINWISKWLEREREMFYLTTHSTHFIYGYMVSDIWLRTILYLMIHSTHFILCLYGIRHIVRDHSDSERGNWLPPIHVLLFLFSSKGSFICIIPQTGFYMSCRALTVTRNRSVGPPWGIDLMTIHTINQMFYHKTLLSKLNFPFT